MDMLTKHIRTRCEQQGIKERDLEPIIQFGTEAPMVMILARKDIAQVEWEAKCLVNCVSRLQDVFVAIESETMKTAFALRFLPLVPQLPA